MHGQTSLKFLTTLPALLIVLLAAALLTGCAGRAPSLGKNPGADAGAFYAQGQDAQENGDYQAAEAAYRKAVRAGSPEASMALVALYDEKFIKLDEKEQARTVVKLARDSGEAGYVPAMVYLAELYKDGLYVEKDAAEATQWLTRAAENGDVPSMTTLAAGYRKLCACGLNCPCGDECPAKAKLWPVEKDMDKAIHWLKRAAEKGDARAVYTLGDMYSEGIEVKLDYTEAAKWYTLGVEKGDASAENNLANLYMTGQGVPQDYAKATELYTRAINENQADMSRYNLAELKLYAPPPFGNQKEAVPIILEAAKSGNTYAHITLGEMYETGRGVKRNYQEAAKWYKSAIDADWAEAMVALGEMYRTGRGVPVDYELARYYFDTAVKHFNYWGYRGLGKLHAAGQGVPRNEETARSYYLKGAESGDQEAMFLLAEALEHNGNVAEARRWYQAAAGYTVNQLPRGSYTRIFDTEPIAAKARTALQRLGGN